MPNSIKPLYLPPMYQDAVDHGTMVMRNGTTASVRVAGSQDHDKLVAFFKRLSIGTLIKRFFSPSKPDKEFLAAMLNSNDPSVGMTLIVERILDGNIAIIATASYFRCDDESAEFAVVVEDAFQGKGLGTLLLERLSILATTHGFRHFKAVTHAENRLMLDVFRHSGFEVEEHIEDGYVALSFSVIPGKDSVEISETRDRVFTNASLTPLFKPTSAAVIGASSRPGSIGSRVMEGLVTSRFNGPLFPVNPKADAIFSIRAYRSMADIPEPVDLAVVVVPCNAVLDVIDDCGAIGVKALIVISAGFAEVGEEGRELQNQLLDKVRGYGMRLVGPNCLGMINTDPDVRMNASFSPIYPPHGRVAMYSQSGALGLAILGLARGMHLGLSSFVSVGNKADVSGNDLLQFWEEDPNTDVILIYLEAFKNPRRFTRIARRVARTKPILCVKGGRTSAGQRAAGSHTAALAGSDVPVGVLFRQTGAIRCHTIEEMFEIAATLSSQPLPKGGRVGIVTNAGGPGILCADTCEAGGLMVPELAVDTQSAMAAYLPSAAATANPVDMIAAAPPEHFRQTVELVMKSDNIDSMIVIYIPVGTADDQDVLDAIRDGVQRARTDGMKDKPVLVCPMFGDKKCPPMKADGEMLPTYPFPESAARVMTRICRYANWKRQPLGVIQDFDDMQIHTARELCQGVLAKRNGGWLDATETRDVLRACGLPVPAGGVATTPDEAAELASQVGFPVVAKLASHRIVHKTEIDGVHLNLQNEKEVREAFEKTWDSLREIGQERAMDGLLIQPMMSGGVEVMVGVTEDPSFGPLIAFGLGGIHVEILQDVRFCVTPLTDLDIEGMITEIKGYRLLEGYRGHPPADIPAIKEVLARVSLMVEEIPEIAELDMNPIFAMAPGEGCRIVDARIRIGEYSDDHPARYVMSSGKPA